MSTRAPPFRMSGSSGACRRPSTVRSTTNTDCASALTTGARRWSASLAPVERTGAGAESRGLGTTTWNARAPSRASASSASSTFTGRDWVSDRIAAASPAVTPQRPNTSAKQSIHFPSIRSRSIVPVFRAGMVAERACDRRLARDVLDRHADPPRQDTPCPRRKKCTRRDSALMRSRGKKAAFAGKRAAGQAGHSVRRARPGLVRRFRPRRRGEAAAAARRARTA